MLCFHRQTHCISHHALLSWHNCVRPVWSWMRLDVLHCPDTSTSSGQIHLWAIVSVLWSGTKGLFLELQRHKESWSNWFSKTQCIETSLPSTTRCKYLAANHHYLYILILLVSVSVCHVHIGNREYARLIDFSKQSLQRNIWTTECADCGENSLVKLDGSSWSWTLVSTWK